MIRNNETIKPDDPTKKDTRLACPIYNHIISLLDLNGVFMCKPSIVIGINEIKGVSPHRLLQINILSPPPDDHEMTDFTEIQANKSKPHVAWQRYLWQKKYIPIQSPKTLETETSGFIARSVANQIQIHCLHELRTVLEQL
ncbi:MAG: hypothetical protein GXP08_14330 [Gammaproteobacteria bacterium]|nr:hypothetical protein [Gammaproteobacteria bacterium]